MYYHNITNAELQYFHNVLVPNFTIKLTDVLTSALFKVETIVTDSIYRICPLFYSHEISSSNPNDKIIDNQVIICQKTNKETYMTFISDDNAPIQEYSNYASYFDVEDTMTMAEYHSIVSLLRANTICNDSLRIADTIKGKYAEYLFDVDGCTILDTGILITDETIAAAPKVKMVNPAFSFATYTLQLTVIHFTDVNVLDDTTDDFKVVETLEIELTKNEWVTIPLTSMSNGYIISLDCNVRITFDKTEIHGIFGLNTTATPNIIQTGEYSEITSQLLDYDGEVLDVGTLSGQTVYFYEVLTPTLNTTADPSIIQTGDDSEIYSKVKDEDGSLAKGVTSYFYRTISDDAILYQDSAERSKTYAQDNSVLKIPALLQGLCIFDFTLTFDFKTTCDSFFFIGTKSNIDTSSPTKYSVGLGVIQNKIAYGHEDTSNHYTANPNAHPGSGYDTMKIVREGDTFKYYVNNNLVGTMTVSWFDDHDDYIFGIKTSGSGTAYVKDVELQLDLGE